MKLRIILKGRGVSVGKVRAMKVGAERSGPLYNMKDDVSRDQSRTNAKQQA